MPLDAENHSPQNQTYINATAYSLCRHFGFDEYFKNASVL
jgi:hypothetical protein